MLCNVDDVNTPIAPDNPFLSSPSNKTETTATLFIVIHAGVFASKVTHQFPQAKDSGTC
jgi:hypothetical protein